MGKFQSIANSCKKPAFILGLILAGFFLRELFLSAIFPMLKGQDESRHYITVQYLAEPAEKNWEVKLGKKERGEGLEKYIASQEFMETVKVANLSDRPVFAESFYGKNELNIQNSRWNKYMEFSPGSIVGGKHLYHKLAALVEKTFSNQSIFFRFFSVRIFSVFLGTMAVALAYFLAKAAGLSTKASLIAAAIMSFQPRFSIYTANVNYDALLIPIFVLFTFGCVLFLKQGANWKNISIMAAAFLLGIFTKGTAIVFLVPLAFLVLFFVYEKIKTGAFSYKYVLLAIFIISAALLILLLNFGMNVLLPATDGKITFTNFLFENLKRFEYTSDKYWGNLEDWTTNAFSAYFIYAIWALEAFAVIGLIKYFISKQKISFLPEKKYALFLIIMLFCLQFGVLFNNWRITAKDTEMLLASPGRYYIPNLASHLILLSVGIGSLLKKENYFNIALASCLILMSAFNFYVIFFAIIPRFYF